MGFIPPQRKLSAG